MKSINKNTWLKNLVVFFSTYIFIVGSYYFLSEGIANKTLFLQMRRFIPCALAITVATAFWLKQVDKTKGLISHGLVFMAWALAYPVSYWLTYNKNSNFIDNHFDVVAGAYLFFITVAIHIILLSLSKKNVVTYFVSAMQMILLAIPLFQIAYYLFYQAPITQAAVMAYLQTDSKEASEFIAANIGYGSIVVAGIILVVLYLLLVLLNKNLEIIQGLSKKSLAILLVLGVIVGGYTGKALKETGVLNSYREAKEYFAAAAEFENNHVKNFAVLTVKENGNKLKTPNTIVVVIGESASRSYLSAYGYEANDTTPWMRSSLKQDNFLLFKNAYTSWIQTVPALERALTDKNQYNDIVFNETVTILDVAKKAGYKTYWFSNQGLIGDADTPTTLIAKTADHAYWIDQELANTDYKRYDKDLFKYLDKVNPAENNFIIFHIMGSHDNFINRYPPEFTKFGKPGEYEFILNYDNSIAYTDSFLEELYEYGKEKLHLEAMLYFGDHGTDPLSKRHADRSDFVSKQIPMFLYLGEDYKAKHPDIFKTLRANQEQFITNDLVYEMVCGILDIKSNKYDETGSIASPKYKYNKDNLLTDLGKTKLTEDPSLK